MVFCPNCGIELKDIKSQPWSENDQVGKCNICQTRWKIFCDSFSGKVLEIRQSLNQEIKAG